MSMVDHLERQIEDVKELRSQADKAIRLSKVPEFRELILEGFCRDEMARLAAVSGDPGLDLDQRLVATDMSRAGGHLKRFLNVIIQQAQNAEGDLPNMEAALAEAREMEAAADGADFTTFGGEPAYDPQDGE